MMLVNIPGKGNVQFDIPDDISQEELDALAPEINKAIQNLPDANASVAEEPQQPEVEEPQTSSPGIQSWEDYQAEVKFDNADFEKKKELFDNWRGKTTQTLEESGALQTALGRKRLNDQFAQVEKVYNLNRKDRNVLEKYVVDIPRLLDSGKYGWLNFQLSEATEALETAKASGNEEEVRKQAEAIKSLNEKISELPQPQQTVGDIFASKSVLPNFQSAMTEQLTMLVPKMLTNADAIVGQVALGAGIGASVGALGGGVGAVPGAVAGAKYGLRTGVATSAGKSSYELEYSNQLLGLLSGEIQKDIRAKNIERAKNGQELLEDPTPGFEGINVNDPEQLMAALDDEALMSKVRANATKKGFTVGAVDGTVALLTAGLASRFASLNKAAGLRGVSKLKKVSQAGALFANEVVGGMGGEALSQELAYGDVTDPNAIAMEGALEIGGGLPVIAAAKGANRFDQVSERLRNYAPKTAMALAMRDFQNRSNLFNAVLGEQAQANARPYSFDKGSFDILNSGLDDGQKQQSFNRASRLVGLALDEAYNVLGLNPDKPVNVKFTDNPNTTFSFNPNQENTVLINLDNLQRDLGQLEQSGRAERKAGMGEKRRQTYLVSGLAEEIIHDLDISKSRLELYNRAVAKGEVDPATTSFSDWRKDFGRKGAEQMTDKEKRDTRRQYGSEALDGDELYSEYVRQLIQKKKTGVTTEETWQDRARMEEGKSSIVGETLLGLRDFWQKTQRGLSKNSPVVREHLKAINSLLDEKQKTESAIAKAAKKTSAATTATEPESQDETVVDTGGAETLSPATTETPQPGATQQSGQAIVTSQPAQQVKKKLVSKAPKPSGNLKRFQARGKYGSVRLVFPDQLSVDAYDAGRRRDGKDKKRDSATLTKANDFAKAAQQKGIVPQGQKLRLDEYRSYIRELIVNAEEGSEVNIPSFEEFLKGNPAAQQPTTITPSATEATPKIEATAQPTKEPSPTLPQAEQPATEGSQKLRETVEKITGKKVEPTAAEEATGEDIARATLDNRDRLAQLQRKETSGDTLTKEEKRERQALIAANRKMLEEINRREKEKIPGEQKAPFSIPKVERTAPEVSEPTLTLPEDEEALGAATIRRDTPRGQEAARAQYFSSIDLTVSNQDESVTNPNADKILDSLINDPEIVTETIKFLSGYIRNNPIFKIEFERMGIKSPAEVANEALVYLMTASRSPNFPENGTKQEQKAAVFRTIKNKLSRLVDTEELREKIGGSKEQVAQESDPEMEQEAEAEMAAQNEQAEEVEQGVTEEEDAAENAPTMAEREAVSSVNPETGEARTSRTADWGDTLGRNLPDMVENQEVSEFSDTAFDENGQIVLTNDPEILSRISSESLQSIGDTLRKIILEAPFSRLDRQIFAEIWNGNADVEFNPYSRQIEIKGVETERDRVTGRAVPQGMRKKRQRSRERIAKWMAETLRPRLMKELGDLRFAGLSPMMVKKLGLNRYRLGDLLGAAKIKPSQEAESKKVADIQRVLARLPDWDPFWLGPAGEIIPVESAVIRMEGMNDFDSHAGEMARWLKDNQPEVYSELEKTFGFRLGKEINKAMMDRGWLRLTNDGNNLLVEGKPGRDQINLLTQKAITLELGLVHDRWPSKSKVLFKPLSGDEADKIASEMDIYGAAKLSVAIYRDRTFKSLKNAGKVNDKLEEKRNKNIQRLADIFGFKLSGITSIVGGWDNPEIGSQLEPTTMITLEEGSVDRLAALLASNPFTTPQAQRAVYIFDTNVSNPTDQEHEIVFKDISGLNKFISNANKLGFGEGFSIDTKTKTLYLGVSGQNEQSQINLKKLYEDYKDLISEARVENGEIRILGQDSYEGFLGELGDQIQDLENDSNKGLSAYFIGTSRSALRGGEAGESTSPQANRRIRGWSKAAASAKLLRQSREVSQRGPLTVDHIYVPVRKDAAKRIAEAYDQLPDFDPSEQTQEAYKALASEIEKQWSYAVSTMEIKFEPWDKEGQPYKSSSEMIKDVRENSHLYYFTGGESHPYLGKQDENGVSLNDKLRAIHDLFGHAAEGYGFGPRGEENAWIKHSQMFSDLAQKALTTETRGQNSWFNFGPHRFSLLGSDVKTEKQTNPYAKQKVALLPEEFTNWKRIKEVETSIWARSLAPLSARQYDERGKMLPGLTSEEIETMPDKLYPGKRLKYSGVIQDDVVPPRVEEPAPWELGAAKLNAVPSESFLKSVAEFSFPLRRMQLPSKTYFAKKIEGESYWLDSAEKNRSVRDIVSDLSAFENNVEVLDFWEKALQGYNPANTESFESGLIRTLNASKESADRTLANLASLFKTPLLKTNAGETLVPMPVLGGNVGVISRNEKLSYVDMTTIVPDDSFVASHALDADRFATGVIPVLPKAGTAERVMFNQSLGVLMSPDQVSPTELREAAQNVIKHVPASDVVRFLRESVGMPIRQAKDVVYGNALHAAKINPIDPSEAELEMIGAVPFDAEKPASGLLTAKGAFIEDAGFEAIEDMEMFSKKELQKYRKNWIQLRNQDNRVLVTAPSNLSEEQNLALAKIVTYAKKPVFVNGKAFDLKKAIRNKSFTDGFVQYIADQYLTSDVAMDVNGNIITQSFENPDFSRKNYNLFKRIEEFRGSPEGFKATMEQVLEMIQEEGIPQEKLVDATARLEQFGEAFNGNSVPAIVAFLTHEVFPSIPQGVRDFLANRLPYFLRLQPDSEALGLVTNLKEFRDWFGQSKVTRPDGTPAVQYYVSNSDIRSPNTLHDAGGAITYSLDVMNLKETKEAVRQAYREDGRPRMVSPVFVKAENPLQMDEVPTGIFNDAVFIKDAVEPYLTEAIVRQTGASKAEVKAKVLAAMDAVEEQSYKHLADTRAFANAFFQNVLKSFGYDSVYIGNIYDGDKATNSRYIVFNPEQIKLANGLNTEFSGSPDVLGAARIEGFRYNPEELNRFDVSRVPFLPRFAKELLGKYVTNADRIIGLRRFWQDRFIDLKKIQESIEKFTGVPIPDSLNAYQLEELYHGKVGARLTDFNENTVEPILQKLRDSKISVQEIEEFLYALHAKERNERIRVINPLPDIPNPPGPDATPEQKARYAKAMRNIEYIRQLREKGSGMTDDEADDIITKYRSDDRAQAFEESRQMIRQMIDGALLQRLNDGLISQPLYGALTERYQNYVPLKGIPGATAEEIAGSGQPVGQGFNIRGEEVKPTLGRLSRAENILAYAMNSSAAGLVRAEKNIIGNALYELVQAYPDDNLWEIAEPETIRRLVTRKNPETSEVFQYARDFVDPTWMNRPDIFATKINGETKFIRIKNPDLIRNLKNGGMVGEHWSSKLVGVLASFMRILSMTRTGLSPEFIFTNPIRDLQTAAFNLSDEQYQDLAARVVKSVVSLKPLRTSISEEFTPGSVQDEWGQSYREFVASGGKLIGWLTGDIETQIKDVKSKVDGADPSSAKKFMMAAADWVEKMNGGVENGTRLAVFHHARELGATPQQAAAIARNATVNFTKKGEAGPVFNSIYLFFNASLQGSARLIQAVAKSPKVRKMVGGAIASGTLASMMNEALGGDDEDGESFWSKVPEFKKRTNIIIMLPGTKGRYVSMPLPYGYNTFWHTGNILSDVLMGKRTRESAAVRLTTTFLESFNPIGGARNLLSMITPTIFQPVSDIYQNQDWAGRPIVPSDFPGDPSPTPPSEKYFNSVTPIYKHITTFLNEISGGNEVRAGAISFSPEYLDYFTGYLTGAVGSTIMRTISIPEKVFSPTEEIGLNDIPILRRFINEQPSYADYERFSAIKEAAYTAVAEQELLTKQGDWEAAEKAREKYAAELAVYPAIKAATGRLQKVKKRIKNLEESSEQTGEDIAEQLKELRDQQKSIIMDASRAYKEALDNTEK